MKWIVWAIVSSAVTSMVLADGNDWLGVMKQAQVFEDTGDYGDALIAYQNARRIAYGNEQVWVTMQSLATVYNKLGRYFDAEREYRQTLSLIKSARGEENVDYDVVLMNLATMHLENGRLRPGTDELREALTIGEKVFPPGDSRIAVARSGLAKALLDSKRYDEAADLLSQALASVENDSDAPVQWRALAWNNLALAREFQGRIADAIPLFEKALAIFEEHYAAEHPALMVVTMNLAMAYADGSRPHDAERMFRRALAIADRLPPDHPVSGTLFQRYAAFLKKQGKKHEAKLMAARSKAILRASARQNGAGLTIDAADFRR